MPTRNEVLKAIADINDSGNNTAAEMRTVLNLLLEHGEENPEPADGGANLDIFDVTQNSLKDEEDENAILGFSFRGFKKLHGNLTFNLTSKKIDPEKRDFFFKVTDEVALIFEELGIYKDTSRLAFVVPLIISDGKGYFPSILQIGFSDVNILWLEINHNFDNLRGKLSITSSIHFHLPANGLR
ncbi:hypothetical protein ESY86_00485 [Subsaximicrobium wynnwilliamsii]|uniref:Uncharacterized protein n=1 Tax=Subsaximicrobium wynnwilliamsii TaxID=291179 RepID=A0A5C6ZLZ6_9FLAO|nr:hypothetical protein [Subsaximicrobium wynnwilliamsii]TXD85063.1 hypothetical protein ESY87_01655 [Subsaximicrobium wynnwilliamsii]TXD91106.1 hypothetical protein ESY86_00485 [Subsaximicrobium wynnwilliamsii]TXE04500.1 hypothetical protein ESY88_03135 [Subsaximicrobium wynnwilliamsii]